MKKITLLALAFMSLNAAAQVLLIDPATEGGFEAGPTWTDNGWTVVNPNGTNRVWYLGTGQPGYTGQRAAFIGNSETNVGNNNSARKVHFYRSVTFPAGATNIVLNFKFKQEVSDFAGGTYYDYIQVNTANVAPTNNNMPPGTIQFGPFPDADMPLFTTQTVTLPDVLAGTTKNLIFSFISDDANPRGFPAIDDISLTYNAPASTAEFDTKTLSYYPNPVKDVLNLQYEGTMAIAEVYNLLGQQVVHKSIQATEGQLDMSSLPAGNYVVKITSGETAKTIKISKQ